jgi:hypothetical protein
MNKIGIFGAVLAVAAVIGLVWMNYSGAGNKTELTKVDYKNTTYTIDTNSVTLVDGVSEIPSAPGSASMLTVKYFGNDAEGDLNGDGISDKAFLITQSGGGSGTFYYLVAALQNAAGGYTGTNAILLGDRIAPQTTEIKNAQILVNYADRKEGQPMTSKPSIGVSKYFKVSNGQLIASE